PRREQVARVEHHARWRDGREPVVARLFHTRHGCEPCADKNVLAPIGLTRIVLLAVAHVRPTVVSARSNDVDLIPTLRAVIDDPPLAALWVDGQPFRILESMRPGFGEHRRAAEPWIAARNRAVAIDVHYASGEVAAFVGIVEKRMLHAVQFGLVQPKAVG